MTNRVLLAQGAASLTLTLLCSWLLHVGSDRVAAFVASFLAGCNVLGYWLRYRERENDE